MAKRYATEARNDLGGTGTSRIVNGMELAVSSPLADHPALDATNPEQLLALAWATCLNATAQVIVGGASRTRVRVTAELHDLLPEVGYVFEVDAYLSVEGVEMTETARVLEAAHARCPVSKLLGSAPTVRIHAEPYAR